MFGSLLGCDDIWSSAVGNTGFIWAGGGSTILSRAAKVIAAAPDILYIHGTGWDTGYTSAQRLAVYKQYFDTLLASLPNLIILAAGSRDVTSQDRVDMYNAVQLYNHPHVKYIDAYGNLNGGTESMGVNTGKGWFTGNVNSLGVTGVAIASTAVTIGGFYRIVTPGSTNWVNAGAPNSLAGTIFQATWAGAVGTGTCVPVGNTDMYLGMGDVQDGHPNVRGNEFIAARVSEAIIDAMNTLTD